MFWKKKNVEKKVDDLNKALMHSFSNVKKDTENIFQWLNYFHKKAVEQGQTIRQLQAELSSMPRSKAQIKKLIDDYYSYEGISKRIKELDRRISEISSRHDNRIEELSKRHDERFNELSKRHPQMPLDDAEIMAIKSRLSKIEQKKPYLKEKLIKRLTKNSKDYVKSIVLSYIRKYEKISSLQLKEMVVEEQGLCSKSSFYRIMEEIEDEDDVGVIKKGKEKHYISKLMKKI